MNLAWLLLPEIVITTAALVLFMLGVVKGASLRGVIPWIALAGLIAGGAVAILAAPEGYQEDFTGSVLGTQLSTFVKVVTAGVGVILLLLCWPTNKDATGNSALWFGLDAGEFFGLLLLSLVGIMLVGTSNDTILLFMGIELASIPTYVLVVMSRPLPAAQEAGVKYFYLGAMAAAIMLLGFAYLYGTTGSTNLYEIGQAFAAPAEGIGQWRSMAVVLVIVGFCFKLAAVPLHFYAGDVYTGAATPVTALLSFVPKATGVIATVKILVATQGAAGAGVEVWKVLFVIAVLTMTVGNVMALLAENLKRMMAYSSIAHSGYMLAALTVFAAAFPLGGRSAAGEMAGLAIGGVLFYLAAYGVMNAGVFGVLMMLPTRKRTVDSEGNPARWPATSAETYADIRGVGRKHPFLTLAMAICCISLIGIPLTVGFFGKFYILRPALRLATVSEAASSPMYWLIGLTIVNAAIAAAYYLRIVAEMVLEPSIEEEDAMAEDREYTPPPAQGQPWPLVVATTLSVAGILALGAYLPAVDLLDVNSRDAAQASFYTKPKILKATDPDNPRMRLIGAGAGGGG